MPSSARRAASLLLEKPALRDTGTARTSASCPIPAACGVRINRSMSVHSWPVVYSTLICAAPSVSSFRNNRALTENPFGLVNSHRRGSGNRWTGQSPLPHHIQGTRGARFHTLPRHSLRQMENRPSCRPTPALCRPHPPALSGRFNLLRARCRVCLKDRR